MEPFDNRRELVKIFRKYLDGTATPQEKLFVETWYKSFEKKADVTERFSEQEEKILERRMEQALRLSTETAHPKSLWKILARDLTTGRVAAAAVLILSLAGGSYYYSNPGVTKTPEEKNIAAQDLAPGADKAFLTLSDGSRIALDNASTGMLARQGNILIRKEEEGLVSYTKEGAQPGEGFNTITAPAGGKYSVVLSDGSRVWLNAESSITFPAAFSKNERMVRISGEVYFEIAKDTQRPFSVQVGRAQKIKVLGTHFNVNAYRDEAAITTTLLEGSVEILASSERAGKIKLKPGEQATLSESGKIRVHGDVNTEEIIAWKNGMFQFEKADIKTVMRQLSRWYNVDVVYEADIPEKKFSGKIDRSHKASEALDILSFTGLKFKIEALPSGTKRGKIIVLSDQTQ